MHTLISVSLYKVTDFLVEIHINMTPQHVHYHAHYHRDHKIQSISTCESQLKSLKRAYPVCIDFTIRGHRARFFKKKKTQEKFKTKSKTSIFKSDLFLFQSNSQDVFSKLSTH